MSAARASRVLRLSSLLVLLAGVMMLIMLIWNRALNTLSQPGATAGKVFTVLTDSRYGTEHTLAAERDSRNGTEHTLAAERDSRNSTEHTAAAGRDSRYGTEHTASAGRDNRYLGFLPLEGYALFILHGD